MALHYWRPDFTPEQARMLIEDYLDDLRGYTPEQVDAACIRYRKEPDSKFFPHTGELLKLLGARSSFAQPEYRLPTWTTPKGLLERPRGKMKSVAEVLRDHGQIAAAEKWEARHE